MGAPVNSARSASWSVDTCTSPRHTISSQTFSNVGSLAGVVALKTGAGTRARLSAGDGCLARRRASHEGSRPRGGERPPHQERRGEGDHPAHETADEEVLGAVAGGAVAVDLGEAHDA